MTLDEAICHAEDIANQKMKSCSLEDRRCSKEHLQLASWLKELKQIRETKTKSKDYVVKI